MNLGEVVRIEEQDGGPVPMPRMRMLAASAQADAGTEVAAGDLTVTRTIRPWFELS